MDSSGGIERIAELVESISADLERLREELRRLQQGEAMQDDNSAAFSPGPLEKVGEPETGWSYPWPPDGERSVYKVFQIFRDSKGNRYGVGIAEPEEHYGRRREYAVVHEVGARGSLDALSVLTAADDYEDTGEMLGLINGKGPRGRQMFRPGDSPPPEYASVVEKGIVVAFKDRITGPYARDGLAIVIHRDRHDLMLQHALIQRHLRS